MKWIDRIFTRRLNQPCYNAVSPRSRLHLAVASRQLREAEEEVKERMNLCIRPRLALVDEELAVVITPRLRDEIAQEDSPAATAE